MRTLVLVHYVERKKDPSNLLSSNLIASILFFFLLLSYRRISPWPVGRQMDSRLWDGDGGRGGGGGTELGVLLLPIIFTHVARGPAQMVVMVGVVITHGGRGHGI